MRYNEIGVIDSQGRPPDQLAAALECVVADPREAAHQGPDGPHERAARFKARATIGLVTADANAASASNAASAATTATSAIATTPTRIHADRGGGTLLIEWADGHVTTYGFEPLRWLCPCAYCRGEAGMPGWLDSAPALTAEQIQLTDLHLVGNYAVSPHWADGHKTGYYPFRLLRDRCPCPECAARRGAEPVSPSPAAAGTHEEHR